MTAAWWSGPAAFAAALLAAMACTLQGCSSATNCEGLIFPHGSSESVNEGKGVTPKCYAGEYKGPELSCNWVGKNCVPVAGKATDKCTKMYGVGKKGTGLTEWPKGADLVLKENCACFPHWSYKGADYEGCVQTPDWSGHHWCYVIGGSKCESAFASTIIGESRKYRECDNCGCQDSWAYWPYRTKTATGNKSVYVGCAETPDWPGHYWCYVKGEWTGPATCTKGLNSLVKGEERKFIKCDFCNCQGTWKYKGPTGKGPEKGYVGCAETPDWPGHKWCYTTGGTKCKTGKKSHVKGENRTFLECQEPCNCFDYAQWKYKGKKYLGCSETPDWKGHTWCYAVGGNACQIAKDSEFKHETRKYLECDACACMEHWKYKGPDGKGPEKEYHGCTETPDWKGHSWCYVAGGFNACKKALPSKVPGEHRDYQECPKHVELPKKIAMADLAKACVVKPPATKKGNSSKVKANVTVDASKKGNASKVKGDVKKFLISEDVWWEWSPSFLSVCLVAFAGTAILCGVALLFLRSIQRVQARESVAPRQDETRPLRMTEVLTPDRDDLGQDNVLE